MPETTFSWALNALKNGFKVTREGWNGKGQYLEYIGPNVTQDGETWLPFIVIHTVQGTVVPWLASQTDLLAEDWTTA